MSSLNAVSVYALVDGQLKYQDVEEIISNNTILAEGHFITTVIYRQSPHKLANEDCEYTHTRWMIFIDGAYKASGISGTERTNVNV